MLLNDDINKLNKILELNKQLGIKPSNLKELSEQLNITRQSLYKALKGQFKKTEQKLKMWLSMQDENKYLLLKVYDDKVQELLNYGFVAIGDIGYHSPICSKDGFNYCFVVDHSNNLYLHIESYGNPLFLSNEFCLDDNIGNLGLLYDLVKNDIVYKKYPIKNNKKLN